MRQLCMVLLFLPLLIGSAAPPLGCVEAGADVPAALVAAETSAVRCLHIGAGVYTATLTSGAWLNAHADGLEISGDGIGKTILRLTDGITLTSNLALIQLLGAHQSIHELTIQIGSGYSGTSEILGISIYDGASFPTVERVEIIGGYSGNGANGAGIATYAVWSRDNANQGAAILDCFIHDSPTTGVRINSNGNQILHNRVERVGMTAQQHGLYVQGGANLFARNTVIQASGYSYHAWQKVQGIDGSGNVFRDNVSIDPGFQHMIVSGLTSNGVNPAIPSGKPLTRYVTITGNTFRTTGSIKRNGIQVDVPATITDNTFEDVVNDGAAVIRIAPGADGSLVTGNRITALAPATTNGSAIKLDAPAIVSDNALDLAGLNSGISILAPKARVSGNRIVRASGSATAIAVYANDAIVSENAIDLAAGTGIGGSVAPLRQSDNVIYIGGVLR
jgi:hypothetical protein